MLLCIEISYIHSSDRKSKKIPTADTLLEKKKITAEFLKLQSCALCGSRNYSRYPDLLLVLEKEESRTFSKVIEHKVHTLHSSQGTLHCPGTLNQGRSEIGYDAEI